MSKLRNPTLVGLGMSTLEKLCLSLVPPLVPGTLDPFLATPLVISRRPLRSSGVSVPSSPASALSFCRCYNY